jgi:hypothetical protein
VADPGDTLDAYFKGVNEDRFEDVAALFTPEATITAPGAGTVAQQEIAAYLRRALSGYPTHHDEPTRTLRAENAATVEITFTGALADGTEITFQALDVFDFDDQARITNLTTWFDSHTLFKQLQT